MVINQQSWAKILSESVMSFLLWRKPDYASIDRYVKFKEFLKISRIIVFSDFDFQGITSSSVFTDGLHVFINEKTALRLISKNNEDDAAIKKIWNAMLRGAEWVMVYDKEDNPFPGPSEKFDAIQMENPFVFYEKLKKYPDWIKSLGLNHSEDQVAEIIERSIQYKKEAVSSILRKEKEAAEKQKSPQEIKREKMRNAFNLKSEKADNPAQEKLDMLIKERWGSIRDLWDRGASEGIAYDEWVMRNMVCDALAHMFAKARMKNKEMPGSFEEVFHEGSDAAFMGWFSVLKKMYDQSDMTSFGFSVINYIQVASQNESFTLQEKSQITNYAAIAFEALDQKMALVDMISGYSERWQLDNIIRQNIIRFTADIAAESDLPIEEILAFYILLPEISSMSIRRDFMSNILKKQMDLIDMEMDRFDAVEMGVNKLKILMTGISPADAFNLVDTWKDWVDEKFPEFFDQEGVDEEALMMQIVNTQKRIYADILRSRKFPGDLKRSIKDFFRLLDHDGKIKD